MAAVTRMIKDTAGVNLLPGGARYIAGAGILIFILFAAFGAMKPPTSDEHWFVIAAADYAEAGAVLPASMIHPPLYVLLTGTMLKVFGSASAMKLAGAALGLGSVLLMFLLGIGAGGARRAALATLLLCSAPIFVQGSLLLDTDNTLVVFFLLAMLLAWHREKWTVFVCAFVLCLWSKLTASLPIAIVFAGWGAWEMSQGKKRGVALLLSLAAGLTLFFVSFAVYCRAYGLPFLLPFEYLYSAVFARRVSGGNGPLQAVQAALWVGPVFCALWAAAVVNAVRVRENGLDMLAVLFSFAIGIGYVFVGGTPFGFPKYQLPAFVLGCWLVSGLAFGPVEGHKPRLSLVAWFLAGTAAIAAVGDPIFTLRNLIRGAMAAGHSPEPYLAVLIAQVLAPFLAAAAFLVFPLRSAIPVRRRMLSAALLACLCQFLAVGLLQTRYYNTLYTYGAAYSKEAARIVADVLEGGGRAALPLEVTGELRLMGLKTPITSIKFWSDPDAIRAAVFDPEYKVIMFAVQSNTLAQMRSLTGREMTDSFSSAGWHRVKVDPYEAWIRKEGR